MTEEEQTVTWWRVWKNGWGMDSMNPYPVEVLKETPKMLLVPGRGRVAKECSNYKYYKTKVEALNHLRNHFEGKLRGCRNSIETYERYLRELEVEMHKCSEPVHGTLEAS